MPELTIDLAEGTTKMIDALKISRVRMIQLNHVMLHAAGLEDKSRALKFLVEKASNLNEAIWMSWQYGQIFNAWDSYTVGGMHVTSFPAFVHTHFTWK